ncbi:type I methionyl aminopeptidase [Candidatus Berkelbacteria bacterium]|nr:type I methionyl aminopeptidase [Candidatus Berkelbacteria bacterium]
MSDYIKTTEQIELMRQAGKILAEAMDQVSLIAKPGVTGDELDRIAESVIRDHGAEPAFLGYQGYPSTICLSVNDGLVHGLPVGQTLKEGDLAGIDLGVRFKGWNVDSANTLAIGKISVDDHDLLKAARQALVSGIAQVKDGVSLGTVQAAIQKVIDDGGYGLVRSLSGHGIGKQLHEYPSIPNFGQINQGPKLKAGMTICLEPMLTAGTDKVKTAADDWTIVSADGSQTAHIEHTLLVTSQGAEILTNWQEHEG